MDVIIEYIQEATMKLHFKADGRWKISLYFDSTTRQQLCS